MYTIKLKQPTENYKGLEREDLLEEEIKIAEYYFPDLSKGELESLNSAYWENEELIRYKIYVYL